MEKQSEEVNGKRTGMDTGTSVAERQLTPPAAFAEPAIRDEISLLDLLIILGFRKTARVVSFPEVS